MPKKIHILEDREKFDFGLIGISSTENDYRMSWILNNFLDIKLVRQDDLEIYHEKLEDPQSFSQFNFLDEETLLQYRMLGNRCENGYLLDEMKNIDYLLQVNGEFDTGFIETLARKINGLKEVSLSVEMNPESLKSRKKLLT